MAPLESALHKDVNSNDHKNKKRKEKRRKFVPGTVDGVELITPTYFFDP